jgi:hypothetical protein
MVFSSEKSQTLRAHEPVTVAFLPFDTKPKIALHVLYTLEWQGGNNEVLRRTVCSLHNGRNIHTKQGPKVKHGVVLLLIYC